MSDIGRLDYVGLESPYKAHDLSNLQCHEKIRFLKSWTFSDIDSQEEFGECKPMTFFHLWPCDPIFLMRGSDQGWVGKARQDRFVPAGYQTTRGEVDAVRCFQQTYLAVLINSRFTLASKGWRPDLSHSNTLNRWAWFDWVRRQCQGQVTWPSTSTSQSALTLSLV